MFSSSEQIKRTFAMGLLIGGVFLVRGLILLRQVSSQNERENALYLYDTVNQLRTLLQRQIALDFQTLHGVAISLGHVPEKEIFPALKEVNDNNAFLRMGLPGRDGRVDLVDIGGELRRGVDLSGEPFFQEALAGRAALSEVHDNPFGPGAVAYCAVPVHDSDGGIRGVLVAANPADVFLNILGIPLFDNRGASSLIDGSGAYVLRSTAGGTAGGREGDIFHLGSLEDTTREQVLENLQKNQRGVFFYTAEGEKHFAAYEPLGVNNWFLLCTVPAAALSLAPNALWLSVRVIIGLALLLSFFLLWRVRSISNRYRGELERLAFVDPLTGVRNVNRFKMDAAALVRRNPDMVFAVWYPDIKNFKFYNEMFGYEMGDKDLVRIAGLLTDCDGPLAICCRVSADKFAGIRPMRSREEFTREFQELCKRIEGDTARLSRAFPLALHVGVYSTDTTQAGEVSFMDMVNRANIALRAAKEGNSAACVFYSEDMRGLALRQLDIESRMEAVLKDDQFKLYFQPKVDIQSGNRIHGAEVLARWHDGDRLVPPCDFIPLFERNGFIIQLDRYMFSRACAWLQRRIREGRPTLNIAVNVSRLSLMQDDFLHPTATPRSVTLSPTACLSWNVRNPWPCSTSVSGRWCWSCRSAVSVVSWMISARAFPRLTCSRNCPSTSSSWTCFFCAKAATSSASALCCPTSSPWPRSWASIRSLKAWNTPNKWIFCAPRAAIWCRAMPLPGPCPRRNSTLCWINCAAAPCPWPRPEPAPTHTGRAASAPWVGRAANTDR